MLKSEKSAQSADACADCGESPGALYQRAKDRKFVCFACLDRTAPKQVDQYPGWREREKKKLAVGSRTSRAVFLTVNCQL